MIDVNTVLTIALNEVGYLEKKSISSNLDDKTADAGQANYTKYWRDMAPKNNGNPWCNCFVNWCFVKAYGEATAKKLLCTGREWAYYTPLSSSFFQKNNQWINCSPHRGDIIYFKDSTRICHVGIVYRVEKLYVYSIEGNTSTVRGVVPNGGGVAEKRYKLDNTSIAGYGRPDYSEGVRNITDEYPLKEFVTDCQIAMGFSGDDVDGIAGPITLGHTVTLSKKINYNHPLVKPVQRRLNAQGYNCGIADGVFGVNTFHAVKEFQKKFMEKPDGEITREGNTWKRLLKIKG